MYKSLKMNISVCKYFCLIYVLFNFTVNFNMKTSAVKLKKKPLKLLLSLYCYHSCENTAFTVIQESIF